MTQDIWQELGLEKPTKEEMKINSVAVIGDLEVRSNKYLVQIVCHEIGGEETLLAAIMRKDGGLQELIDALQSQVIK